MLFFIPLKITFDFQFILIICISTAEIYPALFH